MREFYINHRQDLYDAIEEIKEIPLPFLFVVERMPPKKQHANEYDKKIKQMAHFHRSVVPAHAREAGVSEDVAKAELQIKFARTGEIVEDESGEFDVLWLEGDKLRVFEQGKRYYVQSIAGMSNPTIASFIEKCKDYLVSQYGVIVKEYINKNKTKEIKR